MWVPFISILDLTKTVSIHMTMYETREWFFLSIKPFCQQLQPKLVRLSLSVNNYSLN